MSERRLVIFDDGQGLWGPLTQLRALCEQRTAVWTIRQRIERTLGMRAAALWTPEHLGPAVASRYPQVSVNETFDRGQWLLVNTRWDGLTHADRVRSLEPGYALVEESGAVLAAHLSGGQADSFLGQGQPLPAEVETETVEPVLWSRPWHMLDSLPTLMQHDLSRTDVPVADAASLEGVTVIGPAEAVHLGEGARVDPGAVLNTEAGPIVIDKKAHVHPGAVLEGPCCVGRGSAVVVHAYIRPNTSIGPGCKVGGEVAKSIIQGNSNKAHEGYLGDAIVGRWCNLGAGTVGSNLKSTYGEVRVQLAADREPEATGRRRQGPLLGDLVRTSIGTRLLTGSVIGAGCMLALSGFSPKFAPPLGFYTDEGRTEHDPERLIDLAAWMKQRVGSELTTGEALLIRGLARQAPMESWT